MKIGFIGLGIMGKPMAKNLLKAGHEVVCFDVVQANVEDVVKAGAKAAASSKAVAEQCTLIVTMLPNTPEVKEAVLGKGGVLEGAARGLLLIDMSSIAPLASQEISAKLAEKGVVMLDAPVSGGEPKAIEGTLAIMVGGPQEAFDEARPLLSAMGSTVTRVGEIGSGNVAKTHVAYTLRRATPYVPTPLAQGDRLYHRRRREQQCGTECEGGHAALRFRAYHDGVVTATGQGRR